MRKSSLALLAAAVGLAASQASAADLPRKAPAYVPPPAPLTWTGCYIGANIGGAWGRFELDTPAGEFSRSGSGFAGGGQFGCDYQFAGSGLVIGFRNMFDGTTNQQRPDILIRNATRNRNSKADFHNRWFDALTGRIGYAWQPTRCSTFRAARSGVVSRQNNCGHAGRSCKLAHSPIPRPAGRLAVAANTDSRRTGRCFWKAITTTSARVIGLYLPPSPRSVRLAVLSAAKRMRPLSWSV